MKRKVVFKFLKSSIFFVLTIYACGAKLQSFSEADEIIDKLDDLCKEYKEGN